MPVKRVLVVDYGVGNLLSVRRAFERCGAHVELTGDPERIALAERLVLPGVGAFGDCMAELRARELTAPLVAYAASGRPFLGICVGMQMLFEAGEEFGDHAGLGIFRGRVIRIPDTAADGTSHKVPHVAWAPLVPGPKIANWEGSILGATEEGSCCYFVHSFAPQPEDEEVRLADTDYNGRTIAAVVGRANVVGCQFHPEKSAQTGLRLLAAFLDQPRCEPDPTMLRRISAASSGVVSRG